MKNTDLFEKSKQIARDNNLTQLEVYQRFMFERILERISVSKYRDNFILKGGLLLSAMLGIESRTTRDMDVTIKGIDVSKEKMVNVLNEILSINLEDGVKFKIINITDIREDDEYGGNKYHIIGKLDNLKVELEIDISTGDEVTPRELKFEYISIFDNKKIIIDSYNIETILAEKIETILRRGKYNARMKDYYDVYFFLHNMKDEINNGDFRSALNNTLIKRESLEYYKDYEIILKEISTYERINEKWKIYSKKNKYANGIEFKNIIELIIEFIARIEEKSIL
jgi:predicted nucleotidyltransferase component of viral defense system